MKLGILIALLGWVVAAVVAVMALWPRHKPNDPWDQIRSEMKRAVRLVLSSSASADVEGLRAGVSAIIDVCDEATLVGTRAVETGEVPLPTRPDDLDRLDTICDLAPRIIADIDVKPIPEPTPPIEPVYTKPEYDGAFKVLNGEYYQSDTVGEGVVFIHKNRWYVVSNGYVEGGSQRGFAKGYVRPTGKLIRAAGKTVREVEVVERAEYQADVRAHKAAVITAEEAFNAAVREYDDAKIKYSKDRSAFETWRTEQQASQGRSERFLNEVAGLATNLGLQTD